MKIFVRMVGFLIVFPVATLGSACLLQAALFAGTRIEPQYVLGVWLMAGCAGVWAAGLFNGVVIGDD